MRQKLALSLAAMLLPLSAAAADEPQKAPREIGAEASIAFPGDTTIRNWRADRERGIWVRDRRGDCIMGCLQESAATSISRRRLVSTPADRRASTALLLSSCAANAA